MVRSNIITIQYIIHNIKAGILLCSYANILTFGRNKAYRDLLTLQFASKSYVSCLTNCATGFQPVNI